MNKVTKRRQYAIPYGKGELQFSLPSTCSVQVLEKAVPGGCGKAVAKEDLAKRIRNAVYAELGTRVHAQTKIAIAVSDVTRPSTYTCFG